MKKDELITINDIIELELRLYQKLDSFYSVLSKETIASSQTRYLRTSGVKKMLHISDNKLKTMRENGEIPYSFIGSTYYYPEAEILEILKNNTIVK